MESLGARLQVLHLVDLYAADLLGLLPTMTEGARAAVIYSPPVAEKVTPSSDQGYLWDGTRFLIHGLHI